MSEKVPIAMLKAKLAHYLGRMKAGESFLITDRGRSIAVLEPLGWDLDSDETLRTLVLEGLVTPPSATLSDEFLSWPRKAKVIR